MWKSSHEGHQENANPVFYICCSQKNNLLWRKKKPVELCQGCMKRWHVGCQQHSHRKWNFQWKSMTLHGKIWHWEYFQHNCIESWSSQCSGLNSQLSQLTTRFPWMYTIDLSNIDSKSSTCIVFKSGMWKIDWTTDSTKRITSVVLEGTVWYNGRTTSTVNLHSRTVFKHTIRHVCMTVLIEKNCDWHDVKSIPWEGNLVLSQVSVFNANKIMLVHVSDVLHPDIFHCDVAESCYQNLSSCLQVVPTEPAVQHVHCAIHNRQFAAVGCRAYLHAHISDQNVVLSCHRELQKGTVKYIYLYRSEMICKTGQLGHWHQTSWDVQMQVSEPPLAKERTFHFIPTEDRCFICVAVINNNKIWKFYPGVPFLK